MALAFKRGILKLNKTYVARFEVLTEAAVKTMCKLSDYIASRPKMITFKL